MKPRYSRPKQFSEPLRIKPTTYTWRSIPPKKDGQPGCLYDRAQYYGVTKDFLRELAKAQGYRCAICGYPENSTSSARIANINQLVIDHDHASGLVRGLLCRSCNYGLGVFSDNAESLLNASSYIKSPPAKGV